MKLITTFLVPIILLSVHSFAQTKIGITGGIAFAKISTKIDDMSLSLKMKTGVTAGLFTDIPLSSGFSFQPALNFVQKGTTSEDETYSDKVNLNYESFL